MKIKSMDTKVLQNFLNDLPKDISSIIKNNMRDIKKYLKFCDDFYLV